ncbi:MAG: hypothetical protein IJO29_00690 [Oscillospiraceae bacterium]|nr:hypothetical protein [Oscillospiraceae bacterium]
MKKIDLLALLGNVDAKYIAEAKERADRNAQKRISLDDTCESNEVGIMDSKKYIRKKIQPIIAVAASVVLCVGVLIFITMRKDKDDLTENSSASSISESKSDTQQSGEINVIDEPLGTVTIEGMEIQLPCAYSDLQIYPAYDESKWVAPQESHYNIDMYDQQICFKVSETSENLYYLFSAYPEGSDYQNGTVYSISLMEGSALTYKDEVFVCGETTEEEVEEKLGTQCLQNGVIRNYYYEDGFVSVFINDGILVDMMINSTSELENETDGTETKNSYQQGYDDGYSSAYSIGYDAGYSAAYDVGYDEGYTAAVEDVNNGIYSNEERVNIHVSGEFAVYVCDFVPFYGNNPEENSLAVVQHFQGEMFLVRMDESIADEIEASQTYVFTIDENFYVVPSHYIIDGRVSPEILRIPYVTVKDYRLAEGEEFGVSSLCDLSYVIENG